LGGCSCLAGDFIGMGDFAFPEPLELGDRIVFDDMIHYTMVKTTFFNGVAHPAIGVIHTDGNFEMLAQPGDYASYKAKLG
jgi:carboxynorspermidine decarboxylase